jgi:Hint domain
LITTPNGPRKIEELSVGNLVTTIDGSARPIQFVSVNSYKKSDPTRAWVPDARPVLVRKSAISENVPNRDLYLTQYHSLYLDGVLIPVGDLINGSTIVVDPAEHLSELDYFHIKLESHDVVLAEGAPCETLLTVNENAKNFADYYRAYGFPMEEQPYAPIHSFNGGRSEIGSRLRSALSIVKDVRRPLDIVRDRLEARAASLV